MGEPAITCSAKITEEVEFVLFNDQSIELRDEHESFVLDEDAAYRLFTCLQSREAQEVLR